LRAGNPAAPFPIQEFDIGNSFFKQFVTINVHHKFKKICCTFNAIGFELCHAASPRPSEPNAQDAGSSASATGTTTAEANAPPPSAPQQPQQEQPQSAQPQGPPPKAEPQPPPRAAPAGSAQGPAAEPMPACHYEVLGVEAWDLWEPLEAKLLLCIDSSMYITVED